MSIVWKSLRVSAIFGRELPQLVRADDGAGAFGLSLVRAGLSNAITSLNNGHITAGVNQLNALINQTNAFLKSGRLDSADAQTLIDDIDLAIEAALTQSI